MWSKWSILHNSVKSCVCWPWMCRTCGWKCPSPAKIPSPWIVEDKWAGSLERSVFWVFSSYLWTEIFTILITWQKLWQHWDTGTHIHTDKLFKQNPNIISPWPKSSGLCFPSDNPAQTVHEGGINWIIYRHHLWENQSCRHLLEWMPRNFVLPAKLAWGWCDFFPRSPYFSPVTIKAVSSVAGWDGK